MDEKYILTLDIGTSTIRSYIYNSRAEIVGKVVDQVLLHYPTPGFVEIDPEELWQSVIKVVRNSLDNATLSAGQITGMGISTQRSTFITWSKESGKPFHRFITWKDMRADKLVKQWNNSMTFKFIKVSSYVLYLLTRSKRFHAGSVFKFMNSQTSLRLSWAIQNVTALKKAIQNNDAMFGTLDTWLLHKLTGGKIHMTDVSSASATGFYDPFTMEWAGWGTTLLSIPSAALPVVVDTAGDHFTCTLPELWGHAIPIRSCFRWKHHPSTKHDVCTLLLHGRITGKGVVPPQADSAKALQLQKLTLIKILSAMADQTASMWGSCCFDVGDVKLTMGTGTFFNINTGTSPHASVSGLYPVVGWRLGDELVYSAEGANNDTASIIKWAQNLGLFENPEDTAAIATSVPDTDGVYFIPAFSGLGPPYNDGTAASGFIGMKPSTTKAHLVRAVLESLAFRTAQLYKCICAESNYDFTTIRLDGGVSNNDFIAQLVADLTGLRVERPVNVDMTSLGCAHIVGFNLGIWKSKQELKTLRKVGCVFHPRPYVRKVYENTISQWEDAVKRMCGWYTNKNSTKSLSVTDSANSSNASKCSFKITNKKNGKTST